MSNNGGNEINLLIRQALWKSETVWCFDDRCMNVPNMSQAVAVLRKLGLETTEDDETCTNFWMLISGRSCGSQVPEVCVCVSLVQKRTF
ncbi:MAG: hypothetical protein ACKESB_00060 [Candidatus Hodgkinia cicadicola]